MYGQSTPKPGVKPSPEGKLYAKPHGKPDLSWWDVPLIQEPQHTAAIHWSPQGIVTAHPTKPIILLYPHPPSTFEKREFPPDRTITETETFGPASVLSVSGSGEHVFAYFPVANGSNSGAWCIWINMVLREFGTAEQGEGIIGCWWLGEPRQRIADDTGRSIRLPPLGPRAAFHTATALLLSENFTLLLVTEPIAGNRQDVSLQIITANALRKTTRASGRRSVVLDPYTGHLCLSASLGLAYSDSSIIIAMQAALLPPPCLPLSESQAMGLAIPAAPFLLHATTDNWECIGAESTIRLCEISITRTDRGWDMQTSPLPPISLPTVAQLNHLHFIPKSPDNGSSMEIDVGYHINRYLLVGISEFAPYPVMPDTSLFVYSVAKRGNNVVGSHEWEIREVSSRKFEERPVTAISTVSPVSKTQLGILVSFSQLPNSENQELGDEVRILQIPSLQDDERYSVMQLYGPNVPSRLVASPQGTKMIVQTLDGFKHLGFHPYPTRSHVPQGIALRDVILNAMLSSHDIGDIVQFIAGGDREFNLNVIDSVWDLLDNENGGGGPARWSVDYLRATILIDRLSVNDENKDAIDKKTEATVSVLSILIARSAFTDSHSRDTDGPYDPDCIWPLSNICSWVIEFTEKLLCAASDYQTAAAESITSLGVDPILFLLLHRPLMASWIDSLTGAMQFLSHVSVPLGSNSDNKILLTKSVADAMDQSPVNFPLLLDALIGLDKDTPVPYSEWRRGYRTLQVPETLSATLNATINRIVTPEIVPLLPLHVRMAGMNLISFEEAHQDRDIITKRLLIGSELHTFIGKTTCKRCGGKTTTKAISVPSNQRWRFWEMSFDRCICGGEWK